MLKLGLALGGGGARGAAHIGVLKHFEKLGIKPDLISGTSAGAIVAALYAFNVSLDKIEASLKSMKPVSLSAFQINGLGLFENRDLKRVLEEHLQGKDIEDASIPISFVCTDINSGKRVVLRSGNIVDAVMASCAVPGIYLPVEINGQFLVDGGLVENVPIIALRELGSNITVAVNLNGAPKYHKASNSLDVISNAMDIAIDNRTLSQLKNADIVIGLDLIKFSRFSREHIDELIEEGMRVCSRQIRSYKQLVFEAKFAKYWRTFKNLLPVRIPKIFKGIKSYILQ